MHVHFEHVHTLNPDEYRRRAEQGQAPSLTPYGLECLADEGWRVTLRQATNSRVIEFLDGVTRRASGGFEFAHALRGPERRRADVVASWDERSGIAGSLRSRLWHEPPVALGVIWLTEPDAPLGRRGRQIARAGLRRARAVWAMSPPQVTALGDGWGVTKSRLHLLHKGIDDAFWNSNGAEPEPDLVVSAGNDRHRDHETLIEAMRQVQRARRSARLELVTGQPTTVPEHLGRRHTYLPHPDVRALYRRASVVALALRPNLHISGLSVLLEAMACERAVVATETAGMSTYAVHGETGLLVPPGDTAGLADAIKQLLADPARAREYGRAGRARIERAFNVRSQAAELSGILSAAVAQ
jgi:glycosyltransferase involved in cell wall biosynthesis